MVDMNQILYESSPPTSGSCAGVPTGLWVGDSTAAKESYESEIQAGNIHGILNVALDYMDTPYTISGYDLTFSKVGLCDTGPYPGSKKANKPATLCKAVQAVDQLFAKYPDVQDPQVLVHCQSGGSRSVTIAALWIAQRLDYAPTSGQSRFATAINMVRKCRLLGFGNDDTYVPYDPNNPDANGNDASYNDGKPMAALYEMAQQIDEGPAIPVGKGSPPTWNEPGKCPQSQRQ